MGSLFLKNSILISFLTVFNSFVNTVFTQNDILFARTQNLLMPIAQSGMYKIDHDWLSNNTGWNIDQINPNNISIWTGEGQWLPVAISTEGFEDNSFDPGDRLIFWAAGPVEKIGFFDRQPYDNQNYYILSLGENPNDIRVQKPSSSPPQPTADAQNLITKKYLYHHNRLNLLHIDRDNSGSGQNWYTEEITNISPRSYIDSFEQLPWERLRSLSYAIDLAIRSNRSETITLDIAGNRFSRQSRAVNLADIEAPYARTVSFQGTINEAEIATNNSLTISFDRSQLQSRAWLDEIALETIEEATYQNQWFQMMPTTSGVQTIASATPLNIWAYYAQDSIVEMPTTHNDGYVYWEGNENTHYIVYDEASLQSPPPETKALAVYNNNAWRNIQNIILYHPNWKSAAERLAAHRETYSGISSVAISIEDIYLLFGGGRKTPEAIRNFARHTWQNNPEFKYLLLFGDASFDYQNIYFPENNQNYIPTYETLESLDPILSYPTDDYFALLDEENPHDLNGDLDIAIGRLTVRSSQEANIVVDKIVHYDTLTATQPWTQHVSFLADDEDFNLHINDADRIAQSLAETHPSFTIDKIYFDAYEQVATPGGNRYPDANRVMNQIIADGTLVMNYLGHGGPLGWAQERVLHLSDIDSWNNFNNMPLIITATCSFTGYDDPEITSAGEATILNPNGGAIALFTTVRSVYASQNFRLTRAVFDTLFQTSNSAQQTLGEVLQHAKNSLSSNSANGRKFLLIGDPAMHLHTPTQNISTLRINNDSVVAGQPLDTIGARGSIHIRAAVLNAQGAIDKSFSGQVQITLFDKPSIVSTLQNDESSLEKRFEVQKNTLFQTNAAVVNGIFESDIIIPLDINYTPGRAKISYYAVSDDNKTAMGAYNEIVVTGTENDVIDTIPPIIQAYLNDSTFQDGDEVSPHATLFVDISDNLGINLSNAAIGHDIIAYFNRDLNTRFLLNDFFTLNSSGNGGQVEYPLPTLEEGHYTITIRAFDINNQMTETTIRFTVEIQENITVYNSPNPFSAHTAFYIAHPFEDESYNIQLSIFDVTGQRLATIKKDLISQNGKFPPLIWDNSHTNFPHSAINILYYSVHLRPSSDIQKEYRVNKKMIMLK